MKVVALCHRLLARWTRPCSPCNVCRNCFPPGTPRTPCTLSSGLSGTSSADTPCRWLQSSACGWALASPGTAPSHGGPLGTGGGQAGPRGLTCPGPLRRCRAGLTPGPWPGPAHPTPPSRSPASWPPGHWQGGGRLTYPPAPHLLVPTGLPPCSSGPPVLFSHKSLGGEGPSGPES